MLRKNVLLVVFMVVLVATEVFAAVSVSWMPGFPMRLPGAGVMGMVMPVPGATAYKVQRMVGSGQFETIATVQMNNFTDPAAPSDSDVSYKVVAVIGGVDSGETPVAVLKGEKPILPPTGLQHRLDTEAKSNLIRWERTEGASFYNVYRAEKEGDAGSLLGSVQETRYADTAVKDGTTYFYTVTAVSSTSKESARPAAYKVEIKFPKAVKTKNFDFNAIVIEHKATSWGEETANFISPSDVLIVEDKIYVACQDGVQVIDMEGNFVGRLPIFQEKVATRQWNRPWLMSKAPNGNIWFSFQGENILREVTSDGTAEVSSLVLPPIPNNPQSPQSVSVALDTTGNRWITDENYSNIAIVGPNAPAKPKHEEITRIGYARGSAEKFDPAKDGVKFVTPARISFVKELGKIAVLEATTAVINFMDPKSRKVDFSVVGIGSSMNQVSLAGDFLYYDKNLLLVVDSLNNELKLIKISAKADDETKGDYFAHLIDDTSPEKKRQLIAPSGGITRLALTSDRKTLVMSSMMTNEVYIYALP